MANEKNIKFSRKKKFINLSVLLIFLSLLFYVIIAYAESLIITKNEQELVNMVAELSVTMDTNNEYNVDIIQEQLDKYAGEGKATATQDGDNIYVTYAKTGNQYIITGNLQYTIAYNVNGGTGSIENQIKKHGYRIALSNDEVIRTGYTFLGWDTDSSAVTVKYQPGQTFMANANTTLYAVWTQKPTIKYDANGGENAPGIQIKEPGIDTTLSSIIPTREGYTFLGWSTDSSSTTAEYQPGDEYTEDVSLELYAVWSENYLTVNYYSNYATSAFSGAPTVSASTNVIVRTYKFYYDDAYTDGLHNYSISGAGTYLARTGYTATGKWGTTTSGGIQVSEATSFANGQALAETFGKDITNGNESVDIYAQWKINTYNVIYNPNGGALLAGTSGTTSNNLIPYPFTSTTTTSNGITYTDNGNGTVKVNGTATAMSAFNVWGSANSLTFPAGTYLMTGCPTNDVNNVNFCFCSNDTSRQDTGSGTTFTLTANTAISFKIRIGSGVTVSNKVFTPSIQKITKHTYNTEKALDANVFVRTGYTFAGWNTKADGTGTTYANKASVKNLTTTSGGTVTLYAQWTANTYTVKFNANNGSGTMSNQSFTYDTAQNLTANAFTRTGYTLGSWNTKADGTGTTYANKASVKNLTSTSGGTVNLYAIWTANKYTVKFNANGGSGTMSDQGYTYGTAQNLRANAFTRTGYTFLGWSKSSTATSATYTNKQSVNNLTSTNNGTVTLYAVWKANAVYLLKNGAAQTLAGGFTHYAQQYNSELTYPSGYMQLKNWNSGSYSRVDSNNEIDWSKYSTLKIQMGATTVPTYSTFVVAIAKGSINTGTYISSIASSDRSLYKSYNDPSASISWAEDYVLTYDVSNITTSGKFMIGMIHNVGTWKIKNIWVEP